MKGINEKQISHLYDEWNFRKPTCRIHENSILAKHNTYIKQMLNKFLFYANRK